MRSTKQPNIILILTDDQGYGDLARHGNPVIQTPNLDAFFDQAVRFDDFQVSPTCAPTRCSLMTGKHEFKSGVTHTIYERERMSLLSITLPQILKKAGYQTGIFGKWHLGDEEPYQPDHRGFDEVFIHGGGGIGQTYPGSCGDVPNNSYFDPVILHNGNFEKTQGYCTDIFFNQAIEWIQARPSNTPFFCYLATNAPHEPLLVPDKYENIYADCLDEYFKEDRIQDARDRYSPEELKQRTAKFFGMITNIDENVGFLMECLKRLGIENDTLVIYMNDNGGTEGCRIFNAGMKGTKCTAHYGGVRAMSLWRWPGVIPPGGVSSLTAHVDILPTLVEMAGAQVPSTIGEELDGYSLLPLLENKTASWHEDRTLFTHVGRWKPGTPPQKYGSCSVRWKEYLLFPSAQRAELYNLKTDPAESLDISDSQPEIVAHLSNKYDEWWDSILPCLENEQAYLTAPAENPFKKKYREQYGELDSAD